MSLEFQQKKIEKEISDCLEYGDITKISNLSGIGYSYVDQMLNPNDPRKSFFVGMLELQCAIDEISPTKGEAVWQIIARHRELSKKNHSPADLCLNTETGKLNRETAEFITAKLTGKNAHDQFAELLDIEAQLAVVKKQLIAEFNQEREAGYAVGQIKI